MEATGRPAAEAVVRQEPGLAGVVGMMPLDLDVVKGRHPEPQLGGPLQVDVAAVGGAEVLAVKDRRFDNFPTPPWWPISVARCPTFRISFGIVATGSQP